MSADAQIEPEWQSPSLGRRLFRNAPLHLLNALTPVRHLHVNADIAYGEHPRHMLDLYLPKNMAAPAPTLIFFYGGRWVRGNRRDYLFAAQALASQGFIVCVPDYRLHPEISYPDFIEDGARVVNWAAEHIENHGGNPERIFVMGHSAGAYIAAMLAYDPRFGFAGTESGPVAGPVAGPIAGMIGLAGPYDFLPITCPIVRGVFARHHEDQTTQPAHTAQAGGPPALLLHGDNDVTVRPRNAERLADRLRSVGNAADLRIYPGISHIGIALALARPFHSRAPAVSDIANFVRKRQATLDSVTHQ